MELWASGLNTWGQLGFDHTEEPINLKTFQRILTDRKIEILHTSIYATVVNTTSGISVAGEKDEFTELCIGKNIDFRKIAMAWNDKIAALIDGVIYEYENISAWLQGRGRRLNHIQNAEHIISYRTGFAVLTTDGQVWTWGDLRYGPCLGREIDDKSEAAEPGLVESLLDLPTGPIVKISGSGYVLAALTSGNDLYVWGGRAGEVPYLDDLSAIASPVDIDHDILDMAVGDRHLIVLTTSSEVFVIGDNGWGQLALSLSAIENWQEIPLPFDDGREVVGVHASYKTSFLLVKNTHSTMQS